MIDNKTEQLQLRYKKSWIVKFCVYISLLSKKIYYIL